MSKHQHEPADPQAADGAALGPGSHAVEPVAGFAGPGIGGFAGSAGYSGAGVGGIVGGYAGGGLPGESWTPPADTRHDDRIHDEVLARLQTSEDVVHREIEVSVQGGSVTLEGKVETRHMKHIATDIAEAVSGVASVHNRLHIQQSLLDELKEKLTPDPPSEPR